MLHYKNVNKEDETYKYQENSDFIPMYHCPM